MRCEIVTWVPLTDLFHLHSRSVYFYVHTTSFKCLSVFKRISRMKLNTTFWIDSTENFQEQCRSSIKVVPFSTFGTFQMEIRVPFLQRQLWYQSSGFRGRLIFWVLKRKTFLQIAKMFPMFFVLLNTASKPWTGRLFHVHSKYLPCQIHMFLPSEIKLGWNIKERLVLPKLHTQ